MRAGVYDGSTYELTYDPGTDRAVAKQRFDVSFARKYYNTAGVSYGLQAGAQSFSYVMFFMNESSWRALNSYQGLQIGVGPSVVVLDEGKAKSITSATLTSDVYAFVFGQQGLMAGAGLQGTKITRLNW